MLNQLNSKNQNSNRKDKEIMKKYDLSLIVYENGINKEYTEDVRVRTNSVSYAIKKLASPMYFEDGSRCMRYFGIPVRILDNKTNEEYNTTEYLEDLRYIEAKQKGLC